MTFVVDILQRFTQVGVFDNPHLTKGFTYACIIVTALGMGARRRKKLNIYVDLTLLVLGSAAYFSSAVLLYIGLNNLYQVITYSITSFFALLIVMRYASRLPRHIRSRLKNDDVFNEEGEQIPQQTQLVENEHSVNLRLKFRYKGKERKGYINVLNVFRHVLVMGVQGSGKTYSVIDEAIRQLIQKKFAMCVYAFKFEETAELVYNSWLKNRHKYPKNSRFVAITFDDPNVSVRCNPLAGGVLKEPSDAVEASKAILYNLNKEWVKKQGDFFVETPINYLAMIIWYLHLYSKRYNEDLPQEEHINYCTLPHCIEMIALPFSNVIPILANEIELSTLASAFKSSLDNNVGDQLQGMVDSARVPMTRLSDPGLYWAASANEINLDINNPKRPKVLVLGSSPQRKEMYSAFLGLYFSSLTRLMNRPKQHPAALFLDELNTVYINGLDSLITTVRSNKVSVWIGLQGKEQMENGYGQQLGKSIYSIIGNIFCGQVLFDTAKMVSDMFGKSLQEKVSQTQTSDDISTNTSFNAAEIMPASKLSTLSNGEMAGVVNDTFDQQNKYKLFKGFIVHDNEKLSGDKKKFKKLPKTREVTEEEITNNYYKIKYEIFTLVEEQMLVIEESKQEIN